MVRLSLFSGAAKPVTTGIENNFRGYMIRNNNTFYTLIESDNENVWDMSVEEKGAQQNKDAVQFHLLFIYQRSRHIFASKICRVDKNTDQA
ncbi:hypothetical protein HMH18_002514 [Salmonella enterica]|nr:hypothetical protein [Salmonella enterica]EFT2585507.1 hypothetical protein [Salmonella enterica]EFU3408474.1 hypothetical protein [Salmonella enterica]EFU3410374.1 hypothetical protein [Salmonella enterica]